MKNRILAVCMSICLLIAAMPLGIVTVSAGDEPAVSFAGGNGSASSPYKIATAAQLKLFANIVNGHEGQTQNTAACAELTADIVLNDGIFSFDKDGFPLYNGVEIGYENTVDNWFPIGYNYDADSDGIDENVVFSGTFNGNAHTVSGLFLDSYHDGFLGLFGQTGIGARISSVGIVNSIIHGCLSTGILCGSNAGVITNCYTEGTIASGAERVGGVCGDNSGTISDCYNTGNISGCIELGGICGRNTGAVANCYNTGNISGDFELGGICGGNTGAVANCYNTGNISGDFELGGICGRNDAEITDCYALTGTCQYDDESIQRTAEQMKSAAFAKALGSAFVAAFANENNGFPQLKSLPVNYTGRGDGSINNPYVIETKTQLQRVACLVNSFNEEYGSKAYKLAADIVINDALTLDASGNPLFNGEALSETNMPEKWFPIGYSYDADGDGTIEVAHFTGSFFGNGHTVSGIYYDNPNQSCVGLFGTVSNGANISGTGIVNSYISGSDNIGGICGYAQLDCTITDCYNNSYISGSDNIGGICGYAQLDCTITDCYNSGTVKGSNYIGGVCGNTGDSITNCYNSGTVKGSNYIGGVCGNTDGSITNCYNSGTVNGSNYIGGVCGNTDSSITNCYNSGIVNGSDTVGGICGKSSGVLSLCRNTGASVGNGDNVGGICGSSSGTVSESYNTGYITGSLVTGGVCGNNTGTVTSCYNTGRINGFLTTGGICGDNQNAVTYCYNTGTVTGEPGYSIGSICGAQNGTTTNCYYLSGTYSLAGGGTQKTDDELKAPAFASELGNSFTASFSDNNNGYPLLKAFYDFSGGDGSAEAPYKIGSEKQLLYMAYLVNFDNVNYGSKAYELTADIVLNENLYVSASGDVQFNGSSVSDTNMPQVWSPIGYKYDTDGDGTDEEVNFSGTFNGNLHTVSGLYFSKYQSYVGFFGKIDSNAKVSALGIVNSYISGYADVGGICGLSEGSIIACYNASTVKGSSGTGGICGSLYNGSITQCYFSGLIEGRTAAGGICGGVEGSSITACYNTGKVTGGDSALSGICAICDKSSTVVNCYNTGSISESGLFDGAVCGFSQSSSSVTNCYYLEGSCRKSGEGIEEETTAMKSDSFVLTLNGINAVDGTSPYVREGDGTNDGYPTLRAFHTEHTYGAFTRYSADKTQKLAECTCYNCGAVLAAAHTHSLITATDNLDGTHTGICTECGGEGTERHTDNNADNICDICGGALITVSGNCTIYGDDETENTTVLLIPEGETDPLYEIELSGTGNKPYSFSNVSSGNYRLVILKNGSVTSGCAVTVSGSAVAPEVELYQKGDVNNDGCIDALDCIFAELVQSGKYTPSTTQMEFLDFDGDSVVGISDFQTIMNASVGIKP